MTTKRIEELQKKTAYPESHSVHEALLQVWNEMQQEYNSRVCGECIHYDDMNESSGLCTNIAYSTYGTGVDNTFSCNKFKRKEV